MLYGRITTQRISNYQRENLGMEDEMKIDMSRVCSITRLLLFLAVALSFIGANLVAKADDMAYLATGGGAFGTIDLTTGVFTQLGLTSGVSLMGLAVIGTTLYGAGAGSNNTFGQLYSVNPASGSLIAIGQPTGINYQAFGSYNGTLYALDNASANANLYSINSSTGAATLIGPTYTGNSLAGYYALSTNATALYFQLNSNLYTLNTTSGKATAVGALGGQLQVGGMVEVNGTLYAGQEFAPAPIENLSIEPEQRCRYSRLNRNEFARVERVLHLRACADHFTGYRFLPAGGGRGWLHHGIHHYQYGSNGIFRNRDFNWSTGEHSFGERHSDRFIRNNAAYNYRIFFCL